MIFTNDITANNTANNNIGDRRNRTNGLSQAKRTLYH